MSFHDSRQFFFRCTNSSRNIVTTIETVNDNIAGSVSAIDIREGSAFDICHTGSAEDSVQVAFSDRNSGTTTRITRITATIDMSTYDNLCLSMQSNKGKQQHEQQGCAVQPKDNMSNLLSYHRN